MLLHPHLNILARKPLLLSPKTLVRVKMLLHPHLNILARKPMLLSAKTLVRVKMLLHPHLNILASSFSNMILLKKRKESQL
jgi:hypothetical protein